MDIVDTKVEQAARRDLWVFLALVILLSAPLQFAIGHTSAVRGTWAVLVVPLMWVPALAALVTRLLTRQPLWLRSEATPRAVERTSPLECASLQSLPEHGRRAPREHPDGGPCATNGEWSQAAVRTRSGEASRLPPHGLGQVPRGPPALTQRHQRKRRSKAGHVERAGAQRSW